MRAAAQVRAVLVDVLRTTNRPQLMDELFRPQDVHSVRQVRKLFETLAHASIMKLNKASMDKLFDLMFMGFKFQLLATASPTHLLQVTLNHLDNLRGRPRPRGPTAPWRCSTTRAACPCAGMRSRCTTWTTCRRETPWRCGR